MIIPDDPLTTARASLLVSVLTALALGLTQLLVWLRRHHGASAPFPTASKHNEADNRTEAMVPSVIVAPASSTPPTGVSAGSVSYRPAGKGAQVTTVQAALNQWTSVLDFMTDAQRADVTRNTAALDVTMAVQTGINSGRPLFFPPGTYLVRLLQKIQLEGGATVCALVAQNGMQLRGAGFESSVIKLKDRESTDTAPQFFNLIASNQAISGVSISGLRFNLNGQNNPISPDRASGKYNHYNCSMLIVSGSTKITGADASLSNSRITDCWVENSPGVTCIGTGQSNQHGTVLGHNVEISHCVFHDNGLDTDDHSTLYSEPLSRALYVCVRVECARVGACVQQWLSFMSSQIHDANSIQMCSVG